MNILFIGPYRQSDGWGQGAHDFARMLATLKHNVVCRPIYMAPNINPNIHPDIIKCEKKSCSSFDIIIQRVLPQYLEFSNDNTKQVCFCSFETGQLQNTGWPRYINMVDELWVPSQQEAKDLKESGVIVLIHNIGEPVDITKFDKQYDMTRWNELKDVFNFYFIGEYIPRKNLQALIHAFHIEFRPSEPVGLVIKTSGGNPDELVGKVQDDIVKMKEILGLYQNLDMYKQEFLITEFLTEQDLNVNILHS